MRLTPLETPGANWAAATAVALIAQQVAGKAVRDALFLSAFHAHSLPFAMAAAAALSLAAVLGLTRLLSRHSPAKLLPVLFLLSAVGFACEWGLGFVLPRIAALLVYLHTALFGATLITTFWSLINERFDPHTARRAVARIAGGGTLGGVLGGVAAWRASTLLPLPALLLFLAALNGVAVVSTLLTRARRAPLEPPSSPVAEPSDASASFEQIARTPYLRNLALLVCVGSAMSTLLDYVFSAQAELAFARGSPLLYFFSLYWLAVSVLSFLMQVTLGRVALERLGLVLCIGVLPGAVILGGGLGLAVPGLVTAALLRGAESVQRNTLFRSAYEVLYTPLSQERKRATKAMIDVGFDRLGTVIGSAVTFVALSFSAKRASPSLLFLAILLALAIFPLVRRLHAGYAGALAESLRLGAEKLELPAVEMTDQPTAEHRDREKLIEKVEALQPGDATPGTARVALEDTSALLVSARALLSEDVSRARSALAMLTTAGPAPACAILLLAHPALHGDALAALRRIAAPIAGQLADALLDPGMDFVVRRRIPRVLSAAGSQRAADSLLLALADDRFEVRYQCARALLRVRETNPAVMISRESVVAAVMREIELGRKVLETVASEDYDDEIQPEEETSLMARLARDRVDRRLEHVFTILALHLEAEPVQMAFRALHHDDERHRGTALEYLDTMLPVEVRAAIWPYLGAAAPLPTARLANDLLADLTAALANVSRPVPAQGP